ncbi:zinc finger protein 184-like isoform X2 [Betta splendens]|uniref:Zinc finger protein 184-like isoform X2 n=1 Tax=Betta splendens TaxID=158456 RepID=A0A6P7NC58_BETSP|nr:zinc finger protein 184-like isoform X2 [Betta splendens]
MAGRRSIHAQLSSIMDTVARSALSQVCKLVDQDSAELRLELSRLLLANSALTEKVNSLECELTTVRSDTPMFCISYRSVGVQTTCYTDGDPQDSGAPTIEGVFDRDWCMNLWKVRDPYSLETATDSSECFDKSVSAQSDEMAVAVIKKEYVENNADQFQQETLCTGEHEENLLKEPEQLSLDYLAGSSACALPFEQVVSADGIDESSLHLIPISDTEEAFSSHIIPIEDDDDDDNDDDGDGIHFVQESQQMPVQKEQKTLQADNTTALENELHNISEMPDVENTRCPNKVKYTCQICSRAFFHKGALTRHMKLHKSHFCKICKQHFQRRAKLKSHTCVPPAPSMKATKPCEVCGKTFSNQSALRTHYFVHTGEKPYRCSFCGNRFTQKGNLKCHLRMHTGEKPFHCVKCGKTYTRKRSLDQHLRTHRIQEFRGKSI